MTFRVCLFFLLLLLGNQTCIAETWTKECTAVSNAARINYHSSLMIGLIENNTSKVCIFSAKPPVNATQHSSEDRAASIVNTVLQDPSTLSKYTFEASVIGEALVAPITYNKDLQTDEIMKALATVREQSKFFETCLQIAANSDPLREVEKGYSCGLSDDRTQFSVFAFAENTLFMFVFPVA